MSNAPHTPKVETEPHHGTVTSYVVGFLLSLAFTLIPYYLIVHKSFGKNGLLITVLGFAVLQMVVQVVFFLHLGREKKPHWNLFFLISTMGIILVVVSGSLWIMSHLYHGMSAMNMTDKVVTDEAIYQVNGMQPGTCAGGTGTNHKVMLMDNVSTPRHVDARVCDTLTIMNHDDVTRHLIFGSSDKTDKYAGQTGPSVRMGHNEVITLTEPGIYTFRDSKVSGLSGDFTVTK